MLPSRRLLLLLCCAAVAGRSHQARAQSGGPPREALVLAAASLKTALDAVAADWRARTGQGVRIAYSASAAAVRQVEQGAPADILFLADTEWMDHAEGRNLIVRDTRRNLLGNRLVLIAARDAKVALKLERGADLAGALGGGRLAIGDPRSVPAGSYARQALQSLGLLASVETRLAPSENVRVALALVARGEAPLGIVYETDARVEPSVRVVATFPADSHAPIVYPAALTADSRSPAARAFLDHLASPAAAAVFEAQGFAVLPPR